MGSSDSGGGGDELSVILGYDPWSYPHFPYAVRCWSFVIFGWCVYELLQCGAILIGARAKRRSGAFRSIGAALVFEAMSTILDMVIAGYKNDLFDLPLDKPAENVIDSTGMAVAMAAKCAYVLATVKIIVTVFETSRTLRVVVYATAILALITIIIGAFAVSLILYVAADDYLTYVTTSDINQEISDSTKNTVGFTTYAIASSAIVMVLFNLITKSLFFWKLFKALETPFHRAIRTMWKAKCTQRIIIGAILSLLEAIVMLSDRTRGLVISVTTYSTLVQTTTLAVLAFRSSAFIFYEHTIAGRLAPAAWTVTEVDTAELQFNRSSKPILGS